MKKYLLLFRIVLVPIILSIILAPLHAVEAVLFLSQSAAGSASTIQAERLQQQPERLITFTLESPQLRIKDHTIQVYLPPDYFTSEKRYPVFYLHDGGLLFAPPTARDAHFDEIMDQLYAEGRFDGIIMVGIFSDQNRWDEYSPWIDSNMYRWLNPDEAEMIEGGEGDAYLDFIVETIKPEIDQRYRTKPDRENTAIGGFSMGGLISLYAGLSRPETFSMVMAMSPAIWFTENGETWLSDDQYVNYVKSIDVPKDVAIYIDIGTREWDDRPVRVVDAAGETLTYPVVWLEGAQAAYKALQEAQVPAENLTLVIDEGGIHEPSSWAERFDDAVVWLFGEEHLLATAPAIIETSIAVPVEATATAVVLAPTAAEKTPTTASTVVDESLMLEETGGDFYWLLTGAVLIAISGLIFVWLLYKANKKLD